jgi:exodeoxyribonuclease VII small subunit
MSKQQLNFEEALSELEKIAEKLEKGELSLEEAIKSYEKGMELKKICEARLKEAEGKIELISKSEDGILIRESLLKEKSKK